MMARCTACREEKPVGEFHANKSKRVGRQTECRVCVNARVKDWYERTKGQTTRNAALLRKFGIDATEYAARVAAQGGKCAICDEVPSGPRTALAVDHDHVTGPPTRFVMPSLQCGAGTVS